jgi:twitching motility protein PilT
MDAVRNPCFLVVDDEDAVRDIQTRVLRSGGFHCESARSAEEALAIIKAGAVDVMFADIGMPGIGGMELTRIVQREHPSLIVIIVTGLSDRASVVDARLAGASDYIVKPFGRDDLIAAAGRALHLRARRPIAAGVKRPPPPTAAPERTPLSEIDALLERMREMGGSDLHLSPGSMPMVRLDGSLLSLDADGDPLSAGAVSRILGPILSDRARADVAERRDTDFTYAAATGGRYRCNVFLDRCGTAAALRRIPETIPSPREIGLPEAVVGLCCLSQGLILVTGATGSGKTTTVASMLDHINATRAGHVITIEDPIEFIHPSRRALVTQREVHTHAISFDAGLRAALREDPDVIFVGEMRDLETIAMALRAAETGHLVLATMHANGAASAIDRIIDQFPAERQSQIREILGLTLRAVVAQTLCRRDGGGRVAAREILIATPAVRNLIRTGRTFQIPALIQLGRDCGMVTMDAALSALVAQGTITAEEASTRASGR